MAGENATKNVQANIGDKLPDGTATKDRTHCFHYRRT
jgi:hypothetical protein